MSKFVTKSDVKKKLCIHCKHCVVNGSLEFSKCNLYNDEVSGAPIYFASQNRNNIFRCNGWRWKIDPQVVICENEEEIKNRLSEIWTENYMALARKVVAGEEKVVFTRGGLEKAIERVKRENS